MPSRPRVSRWARHALRAAVLLAAAGGLSMLAVAFLLQTGPVGRRLARLVLERSAPDAVASVRAVGGSWLTGVEIEGVRVTSAQLALSVEVDTVILRYALPGLLRRRFVVHRLDVVGTRANWDGCRWAAARGGPPAPPAAGSSLWTIRVDSTRVQGLELFGTVCDGGVPSPFAMTELSASALGVGLAPSLEVRTVSASATLRPPGTASEHRVLAEVRASLSKGRLSLDTLAVRSPTSNVSGSGELALPGAPGSNDGMLDVRANPLDFRDLQPYASKWLASEGSADATATVTRSGDLLSVRAEVRVEGGGAGTLDATGSLPGADSARYMISARALALNPARLLAGGPEANLNGRLDANLSGVDLKGSSGSGGLDIWDAIEPGVERRLRLEVAVSEGAGVVDGETSWSGWHATVAGTVWPFLDRPEYDLRGDLRTSGQAKGGWTDRIGSPFRARLLVAGAGVRTVDARLTAGLTVDSVSVGRRTVGATQLDVEVDNGQATLALVGSMAGGSVNGRGSVTLEDTLRYEVSELSLTDVDVAGLMADTVLSRVNLKLRGQGSGTRWDDLAARIHVEGGPMEYGRHAVRGLALEAGLTSDGLEASSRLDLEAGRVDAKLRWDPRTADSPFQVSGRSQGWDLGALAGIDGWSTDLSGGFEGQARWTPPALPSEVVGTLLLDSSRVGTQSIDSGSLVFDLAERRIVFRGDLRSADFRIDLAGNALPFDSVPRIVLDSARVRRVDVGALIGSPRWASSLTGTVAGNVEGADLLSMRASVDLRIEQGYLGAAELSSSQVMVTADSGTVGLKALISGPWGDVEVEGETGVDPRASDYGARGTMDVRDLTALLGEGSPTGEVRGDFQLEGRGVSPDSMTMKGRFRGSGQVQEVGLDSLLLVTKLEDGSLSLDSASIWSPAALVGATGTFPLTPATPHAADLTVTATMGSLAALGSTLGIDSLRVQGGLLRVHVTGPGDSLHLESTASANGLEAGSLAMARLDGSMSAQWGADRGLADAAGSVRVRRAVTAGVQLDSTDVDVSYDGSEYRVAFESTVDERRHARLVARLDPVPGGGEVRIEQLDVTVDQDQWTLEAEAGLTLGGAPRVDELILSSGPQRLEIRGGVDPSGTQDLAIVLRAFKIEGVGDLLGWPTLGGTLDGSFDISGPADSTMARASILAAVTDSGASVGTVQGEARVEDGILTVDAGISRAGDSTAVVLRGTLPAQFSVAPNDPTVGRGRLAFPDGPVEVSFRADSFDVEWLNPFMDPTVTTDLGGVFRADVRVGGTAAAPALSGGFGLDGARVSFPQLGVRLSEGTAAAVLEGRAIRLDTASVRSGDGIASFEGAITLLELTHPELAVRARLTGFDAIGSRLLAGRVSGDLAVEGGFLSPRIAGTLNVLRSELFLDGPWATSDVAAIELTEEDNRMLLETFGVIAGATPPSSGLFEASDVSLHLLFGMDNWARQRSIPVIALQYTGELNLEKRPDSQPVLTGRVEAVPGRSYIEQFGRRFRVQSGNVTFAGPAELARIEMQADYAVPSRQNPGSAEVTISLAVQGTPNELQLVLGSDPSMENADIVSYIATGQPASKGLAAGGGSQGVIWGAGSALARDQLVGIIQQEAMGRIGLDVVEIRTDDVRGTTLVAGRYVSPRLYIGFERPISSRDPSAAGGGQLTQVDIEYTAFRWLVLNLQGGRSTLGLFLRSRYAY